MASVEDLIATMNSGVHVGKQGYDLSALQVSPLPFVSHDPNLTPLQAQLAKTLAYNPHAAVNHTFAPYQPITGSAHIPPAPVSSLNSMASTSFNGTTYPQRANGRPMPTPQASFTGFDAPMYGQHASGPIGKSNEMSIDEEGDMEMETEDDQRAGDEGYGWVATGFQPLQYQQEHQQQPEIYDTTNFDMSTSIDFDALNQMSPRSRARPRAAAMSYADDPPLAVSDDDFSAFASDAFAPVVGDTYSSSAESNRPQSGGGSNQGRSGVGGASQDSTEPSTRDGWEAFRRHNKAGAASAFAITPTNRTAPGSPVVAPMRMAEPPVSPWSGRLRSRGSE